MPYRRTLDHVFETVRNANSRGRGVSLLIGAGCSVTAGIPLASGFVKEIERQFPTKYGLAAEPRTYPGCMGQILPDERHALIAQFVDPAKINWPHLCIALLIQHGYVDRVLTTNFDPLVVRACALVNEFPAVYDFAASQYFRAADIPGKAIFYLHGQRGGFVLLNTAEECEEHSERMQPVFADAGSGRVWIVVGYSGENDPVFDHLARVPRFDTGLYWVGYKDNPPGKDVREQLLEKGKYAYFVPGYDADSFFGDLCRRLGIFPPDFLSRPFTHLDKCFGYIADYSLSRQEATGDLCRGVKSLIARAIAELEPKDEEAAGSSDPGVAEAFNLVEAEQLFLLGEYDRVIALGERYGPSMPDELADLVAWAYISLGNALGERAKLAKREEALELLGEAEGKYRQALVIKPDDSGAHDNWAAVLLVEFGFRGGTEAESVLLRAQELATKADNLEPGQGAYNLACVRALLGDESGCRQWLEKARDHGKLPMRGLLMQDTDLDSVRDTDWFQEILAAAPE